MGIGREDATCARVAAVSGAYAIVEGADGLTVSRVDHCGSRNGAEVLCENVVPNLAPRKLSQDGERNSYRRVNVSSCETNRKKDAKLSNCAGRRCLRGKATRLASVACLG